MTDVSLLTRKRTKLYREAGNLGPTAGDVHACQSCEVEMDTSIKVKPMADLRDYLAEERTFLAWVRTGIALMGFGLVVIAHFEFVRGRAPHHATRLGPPSPRALTLVWDGACCDRRSRVSRFRTAFHAPGSRIEPRSVLAPLPLHARCDCGPVVGAARHRHDDLPGLAPATRRVARVVQPNVY